MLRKALLGTKKSATPRSAARAPRRNYDDWIAVKNKRNAAETKRDSVRKAVAAVDQLEHALGRRAPVIQDLPPKFYGEQEDFIEHQTESSTVEGSWKHAIRYFHNAVTSGSPLQSDHSFRLSALFAGLPPSGVLPGHQDHISANLLPPPTLERSGVSGGGQPSSLLTGLPLYPLLPSSSEEAERNEHGSGQRNEVNVSRQNSASPKPNYPYPRQALTAASATMAKGQGEGDNGPSLSEQVLRWWLLFRCENLPATSVDIYSLMRHGWMQPALMTATHLGTNTALPSSPTSWDANLVQELVAQYVERGQWVEGIELFLQSPLPSANRNGDPSSTRRGRLSNGGSIASLNSSSDSGQRGAAATVVNDTGLSSRSIASSEEYVSSSLPPLIVTSDSECERDSHRRHLESFIPRKNSTEKNREVPLEQREELPVSVAKTIHQFKSAKQWATAALLIQFHRAQQYRHSKGIEGATTAQKALGDDFSSSASSIPPSADTTMVIDPPLAQCLTSVPDTFLDEGGREKLSMLAVAMAQRLNDRDAFRLLHVFLGLAASPVQGSEWESSLRAVSQHLKWRHRTRECSEGINHKGVIHSKPTVNEGIYQSPSSMERNAILQKSDPGLLWRACRLLLDHGGRQVHCLQLALDIVKLHGATSIPGLLLRDLSRLSVAEVAAVNGGVRKEVASSRAASFSATHPDYGVVLLKKLLVQCKEGLPLSVRRSLAVAWASQRDEKHAVVMGGVDFALHGGGGTAPTVGLGRKVGVASGAPREKAAPGQLLGSVSDAELSVRVIARGLQAAVESGDARRAAALADSLQQQREKEMQHHRATWKKNKHARKENRASVVRPAKLTVGQLDALAQTQVQEGRWKDALRTITTLQQLSKLQNQKQLRGKTPKSQYSVLDIALLDSLLPYTTSWQRGLLFYRA